MNILFNLAAVHQVFGKNPILLFCISPFGFESRRFVLNGFIAFCHLYEEKLKIVYVQRVLHTKYPLPEVPI